MDTGEQCNPKLFKEIRILYATNTDQIQSVMSKISYRGYEKEIMRMESVEDNARLSRKVVTDFVCGVLESELSEKQAHTVSAKERSGDCE